jgi:hypothetical protein
MSAIMLLSSSIALAADPRASSFADGATVTGDAGGGGSTTGVSDCTLLLASSDSDFASFAAVVPFEILTLSGAGFEPNGDGELRIDDLEFGTFEILDVVFSEQGLLVIEIEIAPETYGSWRFTLTETATACAPTADLEVLPLDDILDSKFLRNIKWLYLEGITAGCGSNLFCPDGRVTRGQMATFLVRALNLPNTGTDYFTDDTGSVHENNINRLRAAGITAGCGGTRFCPDGLVTRAQMATFLVRGFDLPSTSTDYFTDDEGSVHEPNINALSASNITHGCSGSLFCPNGIVTRGQMAAFIHRAVK